MCNCDSDFQLTKITRQRNLGTDDFDINLVRFNCILYITCKQVLSLHDSKRQEERSKSIKTGHNQVRELWKVFKCVPKEDYFSHYLRDRVTMQGLLTNLNSTCGSFKFILL